MFIRSIQLVLAALGSDPEILPLEYQGEQVYRTSHALVVADDVPPQGEEAFGNSARALAESLVQVCGFPKGNVVVLDKTKATAANVRAEIAKLKDRNRVSQQDRVLIVFAVHGVLKDKSGFFQLQGADNMVPMQEVADAVLDLNKGIPAKHVLLLADSCHSGSIQSREYVGHEPGMPLSQRFKQPWRGMWASANSTSRSVTNDSSQSTKLLETIVAALSNPDTYPLNLAQAQDVLDKAKEYIPLPSTPIAKGTFVFALKPGKMVVDEAERAKQELQEADRQRSLVLSMEQYLEVVQAEKTLDELDQAKEPIAFAKAQIELGEALILLPTGNRSRNMDKAIGLLDEAQAALKGDKYPTDWARTLNSLGCAYTERPNGNRSENLHKAIGYFEQALPNLSETGKAPEIWGDCMHYLAFAYENLPDGDRAENIRKAIAYYEAALRVRTESKWPKDWSLTMNNLGGAHYMRPNGDRADNVQKGIACIEASLRVTTETTDPQEWARRMNNLGTFYLGSPAGNVGVNLRKAISSFESALRVYTEKAFPIGWARTTSNLSNVYAALPDGDRGENLRKAIAGYQAALRVRTERAYPMQWAMTMNNLGSAYRNLPDGNANDNLTKSIECLTASLRVMTEQAFPREWAGILLNLGSSYGALSTDQAANALKQVECYEASLRVFSPKTDPVNWSLAKHMLGTAYTEKNTGDRTANLTQAVDCLEAALTVRTERALPRERCDTLYNYSVALSQLNRGSDAKAAMKECLALAKKIGDKGFETKAARALKDLGG